MAEIVCISHLRWDFVWQRPQHLLSRLARQHRVFFVEEPLARSDETAPRLQTRPAEGSSNMTVVQLIWPVDAERWIGHGESGVQEVYQELLGEYLQTQGVEKPILWMYTPMALDFVKALPHSLLVYDVMDQLSAFKGAPPDLLAREETLLKEADLVFTGGASIYRAKLPFNSRTHLFPSGVEVEHFARATHPPVFERPADIAGLAGPLLGYYGVIDERMDLALLARLAEADPEWQILLLGPIVKISPDELPQSPNLHYLGMKTYAELPVYLAFFDVALVPFALNEATRYLSPTKTLEYMAAHKPVVSNPIQDVIELYGEVVWVANHPDEFVLHVETALQADPEARRAKEDELISRNTWDSIAARMESLIQEELARQD